MDKTQKSDLWKSKDHDVFFMDSWTGNQESWDLWGTEAIEFTFLVLPFHDVREPNFRLFHFYSKSSDCRMTELELSRPALIHPVLPEEGVGLLHEE